jgi:hypothetical protein
LRREVATFHQPHREVMRAVLLAAFVERDYVRVIELGNGLDLDAETQARFVRKKVARLHHFQSHATIQPKLSGTIDNSHAAAGDFIQNLVVAEVPGLQSGGQRAFGFRRRGHPGRKRQPQRTAGTACSGRNGQTALRTNFCRG